jgi:hypothetical protein
MNTISAQRDVKINSEKKEVGQMPKMWCHECGELCEKKSKYAQFCEKCLEKRVTKRRESMKKKYEDKAFFKVTYDFKFHMKKPKRRVAVNENY